MHFSWIFSHFDHADLTIQICSLCRLPTEAEVVGQLETRPKKCWVAAHCCCKTVGPCSDLVSCRHTAFLAGLLENVIKKIVGIIFHFLVIEQFSTRWQREQRRIPPQQIHSLGGTYGPMRAEWIPTNRINRIPYSLTSQGDRSKRKMKLKVSFILNKRRIFKQRSVMGKILYHYKQCTCLEYNSNYNITNGSKTSSQFSCGL